MTRVRAGDGARRRRSIVSRRNVWETPDGQSPARHGPFRQPAGAGAAAGSSYRKARDRFLGATTPRAAPAITLVEVPRLFADEFMIEIEAVATAP